MTVALRTRLANILARLDSPFDGEKLAAATLASREVQRLGLTWCDLIAGGDAPPRPAGTGNWRQEVQECLAGAGLTGWETTFLTSLLAFRALSGRQRAVLARLLGRQRERRGGG